MAGRWHDPQPVVRLILPAAAMVMGAMTGFAGPVEAAEDRRGAALLTLAGAFLDSGEALPALRAQGATIDETFARAGSYPFRIADLADTGSAAAIATDRASVSPDTLTLVPAAGIALTLDAVARRFGKGARGPALPGAGHRYRFVVDEDCSVVVELSGSPTATGARVTKLVAIRER